MISDIIDDNNVALEVPPADEENIQQKDDERAFTWLLNFHTNRDIDELQD